MNEPDPEILIDYTNHAGMRQVRTILPDNNGLFFGITEWHPDPQWLLSARDIGKDAPRTFAMKDINRWGVSPDRQMQIDLSLSAQLQRSMELNARMKNRLSRLCKESPLCSPDTSRQIELIMKDEEPTWP